MTGAADVTVGAAGEACDGADVAGVGFERAPWDGDALTEAAADEVLAALARVDARIIYVAATPPSQRVLFRRVKQTGERYGAGFAWLAGQHKRAKVADFTKAPISVVCHSFRLILRRAIIPRSALERERLSSEGARAEQPS